MKLLTPTELRERLKQDREKYDKAIAKRNRHPRNKPRTIDPDKEEEVNIWELYRLLFEANWKYERNLPIEKSLKRLLLLSYRLLPKTKRRHADRTLRRRMLVLHNKFKKGD